MSVLVKGMEMPENCGLCDLFHAESPMHCTVVKGHKTVGAPYGMPRPEWCPLVALPDKHGRLGDLDALCEDLLERWSVAEKRKEELIKAVMADVVTPIIACQPTIVESEEKTNE